MGCQCHKKLWLYKKRPDLREEPSLSQQLVFEKGTDIGILARQLFPGGRDASPTDHFHFAEAIQQTYKWINAGEKIIYEAAFQYDRVMAALDILVNRNGKWYAYEVKGSAEIKDYQITDASLQYYIITKAGLAIEDIYIMHINNQYVRKANLDLEQLFTIVSVKEEVLERQKEIPGKIIELKKVLQQSKEPQIDIGSHCDDPFPCDFKSYCWMHIPPVSVFDLTRLNGAKKWDLYYQGIVELHQLPEGFSLTAAQQLQVRAHIENYTHIETDKIRSWLKNLQYTLYFMDFETFNPAIPLYQESRPFQQIPVQFSVHVLEKPGADLKHVEYLGSPETDARPQFLQELLKALDKKGSVIVYNKTFESSRLKELKELFPQYEKQIDNVLDRIIDLMEPFQKKWYYTAEMNGSYSIKQVLPALVPDLSYDEMEIGEGGTAMAAYEGLLKMNDAAEIKRVRNALLEYCKLDTLAMVKILEKLQSI